MGQIIWTARQGKSRDPFLKKSAHAADFVWRCGGAMTLHADRGVAEITGSNMMALPRVWTLEPRRQARLTAQIEVEPTGRRPYFPTSILMVVPAVAISTVNGALNGHVLTKWRFRVDTRVFGLLLFSCFILFQIVLIPMVVVLGMPGLAESEPGVVLAQVVYPNMTVALHMPLALEMHGVPRAGREVAPAPVTTLLQIDHLPDRKPGQLSGGQRQRVAMGPAPVRKPDVVLFDAPPSNLDAKLRVDMRTEVKKLHQTLKTTIVYMKHDQIETMTLSTRIAVMDKGYAQQLATPKEIQHTPANVCGATVTGSPPMNIVPSAAVMQGGVPHEGVADPDGATRHLRFSPPNLAALTGKPILPDIRPEAIADPEGADRKSGTIVALSNREGVTDPAGSDTFVTMTLWGRDIVARMRTGATVAPARVFVSAVNVDKAVAFDPAAKDRIAP